MKPIKSKHLLAAAVVAAFAASGAIAGGENKQAASGGASASKDAPIIVLVPVQVAARDTLGDGCWARLYDGQNFRGNQLSLIGPVDMPNMRTAFGTDWAGQFDSLQTGPKATLTVYDNENYQQKSASFKPGQKVEDLSQKLGAFEEIRSVKIACAGGTPTAQGGQPFSALDKDNDGSIGRLEAAADADAKSKFETLDKDNDEKLSRSEYEASGGASSKK